MSALIHCRICKRPLENPLSVRAGIGPDCAEKQQKFIASCSTSIEEIGQLTLLDNPTVTRWVAKFAAAVRAGRRDHAQRFIDAARRAADAPELDIEIDKAA